MKETTKSLLTHHLTYKFSFLFLLFLGLTANAFSQAPEKCFRGTVKDVNNDVVTGAKIRLVDSNNKTIFVTESNEVGEFYLNCFSEGNYSLHISQKGLADSVKNLNFADKNLQVSEIVLETRAVEETVNVFIEPEFVSSVSETAMKIPTPLRDIPQSVEIVNRNLLDSQAALSMKDALYNVTAVSTAQGEGRRDQFFIRGFSAIGDQFVDGIRDDALYYRDLSNIEQVEVVKGPSAVLFGYGSSGGIINRVTKKPNYFGRVGSFEGMLGSYGLKRGSFDYGQPIINEKLAFRFVGAYEKTGSFRHHFFQDRFNLAPSIAWKPTEKTDVTFQFEYLNDHRLPDRGIPSFQGRPADVPIGTYYGNPELDDIRSKVNSQALKIEHQLTNLWTIRNYFRRIGYDTEYDTTFPNGVCLMTSATTCTSAIPSGVSINDDRLRVNRGQYEGTLDQKNYFNQTEAVGIFDTFGIQHTFLAGVEIGSQNLVYYRSQNTTQARTTLFDPVLVNNVPSGAVRDLNEFDGRTIAVYVQDQITFNKNWKALIGIRYDDLKQELNDLLPSNADLARTDKQWSPRVGLVYQPNDWLTFYTSFTRSFQPSGEHLSLAANNSELGPEQTKNYEAGVKAFYQPLKLNATLAVFRLDRDNIKTINPLVPGELILVGEQRTDGIELTVSGSPIDKFDIYAGYAFLDAVITKSNNSSGGVPLQGRFAQMTPKHSGNVWLTYQLPKNFRIGFGGYARDKMYTSSNNLVALPGYARFDASISWKSEKHYEIAFNLKNITNRKYYETAHNDNQITPGAPINGSLTFRYRW